MLPFIDNAYNHHLLQAYLAHKYTLVFSLYPLAMYTSILCHPISYNEKTVATSLFHRTIDLCPAVSCFSGEISLHRTRQAIVRVLNFSYEKNTRHVYPHPPVHPQDPHLKPRRASRPAGWLATEEPPRPTAPQPQPQKKKA